MPKITKLRLIEMTLGLLCTIFVLVVDIFPVPLFSRFIKEMDGRIYDQMISMNWHAHKKEPRVVIIDIDEESVNKEGRWPWPRDKMADLILKLKQAGVVTMGIDIVMSEAEINYALGLKSKIAQLKTNQAKEQKQLLLSLDKFAPEVDNDRIFAQSLLDHNVVLGYLFHHDANVKKGVLPKPLNYSSNETIDITKLQIQRFQGYNGSLNLFVTASANAGFVTNFPDSDGTVRHSLILANYNNQLYPSLALKTAMNYLLEEQAKLVTHNQKLVGIELSGGFIPTNSLGQVLIPFWGTAGTLDYYSASDILQNKINSKELEGTIAIIGSSMTLLSDLHQAPVSQLFPGVEMVGNLVEAIVGQKLTSEFTWESPQGVLYLLLFGIGLSLLFSFLGFGRKLAITMIIVPLILVSSVLLFVFYNVYIPTALLLMLIALQAIINYSYSYMIERRQKNKISQLFGQYVPEDYVKELIEFPGHFSMEGQTRNMTVQFIDIRNFTGITEVLDATDVKRLLNTFFTPITEIIFSHRGTIDKYVGDMIVAFWGAPMEDKDHAYNAIMASLTVFKHLPEINAKMIENKLPTVNIGVGLATGLMNVGDMGSEFRRAYTVLGDVVNLGSRLQDLTKFYHVDILVSDITRFAHDDFIWQAVDKVSVKGRKNALTIYQPLGLLSEAFTEQLAELEEHHQSLHDYYAQNWLSAEKRFKRLKKEHPDTYLYQLYLERIKVFKKHPPPADWNGVYTHTHK